MAEKKYKDSIFYISGFCPEEVIIWVEPSDLINLAIEGKIKSNKHDAEKVTAESSLAKILVM